MNYVFRWSTVKGEKYLQVWKKEGSEYSYAGSVGSAEKAASLLVKIRDLQKLTNYLREKLTNLRAEHDELLTKLGFGGKT